MTNQAVNPNVPVIGAGIDALISPEGYQRFLESPTDELGPEF
jgi:hypothetical protein